MNVSHLLEGLCYFTVLIVAMAWLCVVCDPFPAEEPEALQLGKEWL